MEAPNSSIAQHLEGFLLSARKLEDALAEEKKRSQKIAQEYLATRTTLENAVRELQNRLIQRENKIQAITAAYQNLQTSSGGLKNELRELAEREKKTATELTQYKSAWSEVLAREAQARGSILEFEKAKHTLNEQRSQLQALEQKVQESHANAATHSRQAETYQRELQSALIRIQTAEAKYSQIQKEFSALSQSKRNADEEIARIETSMKERFRWELAAEKERLRADLEKNSVLDRERFREIARNQMRAEIDRQVLPERQAREAAETELAQARQLIAETEAKRNQDNERARARVLSIAEENQDLKEEMRTEIEKKTAESASIAQRAERAESMAESLKRELAMHQLEANQSQIKIEMVRKESSKTMLIEHLRHEEEVRELRTKIESLLERGIYAEKVDEVSEGMRIYSATPVGITRSSRDANPPDHSMKSEENTL